MNVIPKKKFTVQQYLQLQLAAGYKSKYYNGEIFPMGEIEGDKPEAMAGASWARHIMLYPQTSLSLWETSYAPNYAGLMAAIKEFLSLKPVYILTPIFLFFAVLCNFRTI